MSFLIPLLWLIAFLAGVNNRGPYGGDWFILAAATMAAVYIATVAMEHRGRR